MGIQNVESCAHSDRPHYAHGLCKSCYNKRYYPQTRARAEAKKLVRQVRSLVGKFLYARNFMRVSKANRRACIVYQRMLKQRAQKVIKLGFEHLLDIEITLYMRTGPNRQVGVKQVIDMILRSGGEM